MYTNNGHLDVFNVRAFNAKGNGSADDTAAINGAINAAVAAGGGTVFFPPGTYKVTSAITTSTVGLHFAGAGMASVINGASVTTGGSAILTISGSRCSARDFRITAVHGVTGLRVSGQISGSCENVELENIFIDGVASGGIAFGIGDNTATDTSEVCLIGCSSIGDSSSTTHIQIGNGSTGNVLDISNFGGNAQVHAYGVVVSGGSFISNGLNFESSHTSDIFLHQSAEGAIQIRGGRSENAARFLICQFGHTAYSSLEIADYVAIGLQNTDGQGIQITTTVPLRLKNIFFTGNTVPQYIQLPFYQDPPTGIPSPIEIESCTNDAPYMFSTPWSRRGDLIRVKDLRFAYDGVDVGSSYGGGAFKRVRRIHVTTNSVLAGYNIQASTALTGYPDLYDTLQIGLSENYTGTFKLAPGSFLGQKICVVFVQDGIGGWTYSWPINVAFSGESAPPNITSPRNRQTTIFEWTGDYWQQTSPTSDILPPSPITNVVMEDFSNPSPSSLYLIQPYHSGTASGTNIYETVPGAGSLGISGGVCVTNSLGWLGDSGSYNPVSDGLLGAGAGVVIETGMATQLTGISATFKWEINEGLIVHYLDDSTFMAVYLTSGLVHVVGFSDGVQVYTDSFAGPSLTAGTSHTLLVKCVSTQLQISVDGGGVTTITPTALWNDLTKHGGFFSSSTAAQFSAFSVT